MSQPVGRSHARQRLSALCATALLAGGICAAASAQEPEDFFVRGVGATAITSTSSSSINTLGLVCGAAGTAGSGDCESEATATMKVSAKTKNKLGLASRTIAKGGSKAAGEGVSIKMKASSAVRRKLRKAESVKVTYTVSATSPVREKFTQTVTMGIDGGATVKRLLIRSSDDTFDFGGGRG